jgi:hypothetical protein
MRKGERWVWCVLVTVLVILLGGYALLVGLFAVHGCPIWRPGETDAVRAATELERVSPPSPVSWSRTSASRLTAAARTSVRT